MLFRPEEVHGASGIGNILRPPPIRYGHIPHEAFGFGSQDFPIADLHAYREATVKTGSIDLHCFAGKEPADRQRLEPSLAEPFLPAIDGDPVLGGEVVKGSKRGDIVRTGE
jgi:hypothetical protein